MTPQFPLNLVAISTLGLFYLNITVTANPFVIPGNITVVPPSGVSFPAQFQLASVVNDTGTAYAVLNSFQLPQYAGYYSININHPAVGALVIQFNLTVMCKLLNPIIDMYMFYIKINVLVSLTKYILHCRQVLTEPPLLIYRCS